MQPLFGIALIFTLLFLDLAPPVEAQNVCRLADGTPVTLAALPANTWCVADNSVLYDAVGWKGNQRGWPSSASAKRVTAESGAALDHTRDRLIVFGGGHAAYYGNEVYVFDVATLAWSRLTNPSLPSPEYCGKGQDNCSFYLGSDSLPRSRHTHDGLEYIPETDEVCALGAYGTWRQASAGSYNTVSCFNFKTLKWRRRADATLVTTTTDKGFMSARDPKTGTVYARSTDRTMQQWNPVTDKWSVFTATDPRVTASQHTMALDPIGRKLYSAGRFVTLSGVAKGPAKMFRWDLNAPGRGVDITPQLSATCMEFVSARAPGFEWHPPSGKFLAWFGRPKWLQPGTDPSGGTIYTFDPTTLVCEKIPPAANSKIPPQSDNPSGVYGRWAYVSALDVFVGVHSATTSVYVYRAP